VWECVASKKYFKAIDKHNNLLALLVARPVGSTEGYYVSLIRHPSAPIGTLESLTVCAIEHFQKIGINTITFGSQSVKELGGYEGVNGLQNYLVPKLYNLVLKSTDYKETTRFYKKLGTEDWQPSYMVVWPKTAWLKPMLALGKFSKAF